MFIRYDLTRIISLYEKDQIDRLYIDINGEKHFSKWKSASDLLIEIKSQRLSNGLPSSRSSWSFIDRTGSVPSIIQTHIDDEQLIPTGKPKSLDILDICLERASELLNTGKHITVLWSGGVDSTLALFSLIRQASNLDQLSILCTFESILESGGLFDSVIKNSGIRIKFDTTRYSTDMPFSYDSEDLTQIYITGQCADQLYGAPAFLKSSESDDNIPWYNWYVRDTYNQNFLELIEPTIKYSERPIETVHDLRWWAMFNYGWTTVLYDDLIGRPAALASRIKSFYATPEFQRWAIHTPTYYENPVTYDDPIKYKVPLKRALNYLLDYPPYVINKGKGVSIAWKKHPNWYLLDRNFKTYYIDQ
jgi:hypothetical protein